MKTKRGNCGGGVVRVAIVAVGIGSFALSPVVNAANYWFDVNGTTAGYGVANGATYNWLGTGPYWGNFAGTATPVAWPGGSNQAYPTGAGAGTTYTVRLGADGSSGVTLQNLAINIDSATTGGSGAGNVTIGNTGDTGVLTLNAANSVGAQGGGRLTVNNPINLNGFAMTYRGGDVVINGNISGAGTASALNVSAGAFGLTTGTLTLNGTNTYGGATTLGALTLKIAGGSAIPDTSTVSLSNDASVFDVQASETIFALTAGSTYDLAETKLANGAVLTVSPTTGNNNYYGKITGLGGLTVNGNNSATVQLLGTNSYSGATIVNNQARFNILANGALSPNTAVTVNSGGQLNYGAATYTIANNFTLAGNGDSTYNLGALRLTDGNDVINTITLAANARIGTVASATNNVTISGKITGNYGVTFAGRANGTGSQGVFTLSNTGNDYTGDTTVLNQDYNSGHSGATTLKLGASNVIPNGSSVALNGPNATYPTVLEMNGFSETINGLGNSAAAGAIVQNSTGSSTLTVGDGNATASFSGVLRDNGGTLALTKTGTGTQTLGGICSYTGATTVNAGTLQIAAGGSLSATAGVTVRSNAVLRLDGTTGLGLLTVEAGGFLQGTGTAGGTTDVYGVLAPGNSAGALTLEETTLRSNAVLRIELGGYAAGTGYDQLQLGGNMLTLADGAELEVSFLGGFGTTVTNDAVFTIAAGGWNAGEFTVGGTVRGEGAQFDVDSRTLQISYNGGGDITLTVIPEPGTIGLIGLVGLAGYFRRRLRG